jgi:hypothetical protein
LESVYPLEVSGAGSANQWEPVEIEDESLAGFAMTGSVLTVLKLGELQWAFQVETDDESVAVLSTAESVAGLATAELELVGASTGPSCT